MGVLAAGSLFVVVFPPDIRILKVRVLLPFIPNLPILTIKVERLVHFISPIVAEDCWHDALVLFLE